MAATRCFIDFGAGDQAAYEAELVAYNKLKRWLHENGEQYGLTQELSELDEVGRETLAELYREVSEDWSCYILASLNNLPATGRTHINIL